MATIDVYRVTDKLDQGTIDVLVARLEARARHPRFAQILSEYLDAMAIDQAGLVLELGCGTGVVARTIAQRTGFSGKVIGVDRSAQLASAATQLAKECNLQDKTTFSSGDSQRLDFADGTFDAVVAHTLLSHVESPRAVLTEAARVLKPRGRLAVFDGDYASLTFGGDDSLGKADDETIINAIVTNPRVMRQLPEFLTEAGFLLDVASPHVIADIGRADFWEPMLTSLLRLLPTAGAMTEDAASQWVARMRQRSDQGNFFGASNYYTYIATKSGPKQ